MLLVPVDASLPDMIRRASTMLAEATSAAEVLDARKEADRAYHKAKASRFRQAQDAHSAVLDTAERSQAEALMIIAKADERLADEYDAAQGRDEIAKLGTNQTQVGLPSENTLPTVKDLGITSKDIFNAREVRDAEKAEPGIVAATLKKLLADGIEPTKARLRDAISAQAKVVRSERFRTRKKRSAEKNRKKAEARVIAAMSGQCELHNETCIDAMSLPAASIDWVITDPPYPKKFLPVFQDLALVADHCLKPGGSLLCMVGHLYMPDILAMLGERLTYHWVMAYLLPGGQAAQMFTRKVLNNWKPVLWFVKGEYQGDWTSDVARSDTNDNDKRFHEWGQSESGMADLMGRFVQPGETVLDPFMGGGTTGVVALTLGASFIGYDNDADAFEKAAARLSDARMVA